MPGLSRLRNGVSFGRAVRTSSRGDARDARDGAATSLGGADGPARFRAAPVAGGAPRRCAAVARDATAAASRAAPGTNRILHGDARVHRGSGYSTPVHATR